jgi:hypothetical protein
LKENLGILPDAMHCSLLHTGWSVRFAVKKEKLALTTMNCLQINKLLFKV